MPKLLMPQVEEEATDSMTQNQAFMQHLQQVRASANSGTLYPVTNCQQYLKLQTPKMTVQINQNLSKTVSIKNAFFSASWMKDLLSGCCIVLHLWFYFLITAVYVTTNNHYGCLCISVCNNLLFVFFHFIIVTTAST